MITAHEYDWDDDMAGENADVVDWSKHPCKRPCKFGEAPMECRYKFIVESYHTMSKACYDCPRNITDCYRPHCITADGKERPITVVNRQMPGPSIEVTFSNIFLTILIFLKEREAHCIFCVIRNSKCARINIHIRKNCEANWKKRASQF